MRTAACAPGAPPAGVPDGRRHVASPTPVTPRYTNPARLGPRAASRPGTDVALTKGVGRATQAHIPMPRPSTAAVTVIAFIRSIAWRISKPEATTRRVARVRVTTNADTPTSRTIRTAADRLTGHLHE